MPLPSSIRQLLEQLDNNERNMPPTILYNEGWMLRMVLHAGASGFLPNFFPSGMQWYSEAQLRTPFGKDKGAKHESNTHADGIIGKFLDTEDSESGLKLSTDSKSFLVLEAKMNSPLSSGTKHAPGYDQAARNVACMAQTLKLANCQLEQMSKVGFYVIAPKSQIDSGIFEGPMSFDSIRTRVSERIHQFTGASRDELERWREDWFLPLVYKMGESGTVKRHSWEELIQKIKDANAKIGNEIEGFYEKCKEFNRIIDRAADVTGRPVRGMLYLLTFGNFQEEPVRVCSAGLKNSRVYRENWLYHESFLVPNLHLSLVPDSIPVSDPISGHEYVWEKSPDESISVRVINVGDCNSRVLQLDTGDAGLKAPNYQLRTPETKPLVSESPE